MRLTSDFFCQKTLAYPVSQVGGHDEIVLDHETGFLGVQDETLNDLK
jgi:hypothetical protein